MPRSARSSSTSRYERPNRRYHRSARVMTSGGNRYPAKAELCAGRGRGRRCDLMEGVSPKQCLDRQCNSASPGARDRAAAAPPWDFVLLLATDEYPHSDVRMRMWAPPSPCTPEVVLGHSP